MRIHNDNAELFMHSLAVSIEKDPLSLEHWKCLHIKSSELELSENLDTILAQYKYSHPDIDCDVVRCADNDVFVIMDSLNNEEIHGFADDFVRTVSCNGEHKASYTLYDVFRDWREVRETLVAKTKNSKIALPDTTVHSFDEITSFEEIFIETKKLRQNRQPIHVMMVEDDVLTRRLVTNIFKNEYSLITAANAQEAVSNYLLHAPDIVFLDIGLPDASGFDVLQQIIKSDKDAYVVMFSGNSYLDNVVSALSHGASGFIAKPFKKEKMNHYIQNSILHHQSQCL
jgi:CheY-like chemotaxis protein